MSATATSTKAVRVSSTNDLAVELYDLGGSGPTLLIAHATGFCAGPYQPLAQELAQHFHVWALDFRGHGRSERPANGDFAWSSMIDDVLAVHRHLGGGEILGFGHSMGGACLLGAARRSPGTFKAIWAYEPIVIPDEFAEMGDASNHLSAAARRRRAQFASKAEVLHRYASRPPLGVFRADVLWHYVEDGFVETQDGQVELRCAPNDEAAVFEATNKPLSSHMDQVDLPVTIAIGGRDPGPGPAEFGRRAFPRLPQGRLREYELLGHFGPFQDPFAIAQDVIADLAVAER